MKYILFSLLSFFLYAQSAFAEGGLFGNFGEDKVNGYGAPKGTNGALRTGNVDIDDIPNMINSLIDIGIGIAGTISVIFVIIGAYQILFGNLEGNTTKGRETIIMALGGFAIASLSYYIIKLIINNFS